MKRIMWFFALIPVAVTSIVLQFMPDIIPMHHDLAGNTDRWGSKMESFIFPVIIMFITLFCPTEEAPFGEVAGKCRSGKRTIGSKISC